MDSLHPFSPGANICYNDITSEDHAWLRCSVWMFFPEDYSEDWPLLVLAFNHKGKPYKYRTFPKAGETLKKGEWNLLQADYLTPEVRSENDTLFSYVWHRGKSVVFIDDLKIDAFEPK